MYFSGSDIVGQVRDRADVSGSSVVLDSEIYAMINSSMGELHSMKVQAFGDNYFLQNYDFQSTAGTSVYTIPVDTFKIFGVDILGASGSTTEYRSLKRFDFSDRDSLANNNSVFWFGDPTNNNTDYYQYAITGESVRILPEPTTVDYFRVWYVPPAVQFSGSTHVLDFKNQWQEFVVVDTCIKVKEKQEQDTNVLQLQRAQLLKRLESEIPRRDIGQPIQIMRKYRHNWKRNR